MYGKGVYFARGSYYSARAKYTPLPYMVAFLPANERLKPCALILFMSVSASLPWKNHIRSISASGMAERLSRRRSSSRRRIVWHLTAYDCHSPRFWMRSMPRMSAVPRRSAVNALCTCPYSAEFGSTGTKCTAPRAPSGSSCHVDGGASTSFTALPGSASPTERLRSACSRLSSFAVAGLTNDDGNQPAPTLFRSWLATSRIASYAALARSFSEPFASTLYFSHAPSTMAAVDDTVYNSLPASSQWRSRLSASAISLSGTSGAAAPASSSVSASSAKPYHQPS